MKNLIFIFACICTTLSVQAQDKQLAIVGDRTDALELQPTSQMVKKYFDLSRDRWQAVSFSLSTVTNLSYNKEYKISLGAASNSLFSETNDLERAQDVKKFHAGVDAVFTTFQSIPAGRGKTSLYATLAKTLNTLSESKAHSRELWLFSDCAENSTISFYDAKTLQQIQDDPGSFIAAFEKQVPIKDLHGVIVRIYFLPATEQEDVRFTISSKLFVTMLEMKGAKVYIN